MPGRRIVFITDLPLELEFAPVSRLFHLARICAANGADVQLLGCRSNSGLSDKLVDVVHLPIPSPGKGQARVPFNPVVRRAVADADAVVVRGYFVAFWILRFAVRKKLKVRILDFHGSSWLEKANRSIVRMLSKYMEVTSFRNATHILSVSRGCAEHVGDLVRDKVVILQNGVDHKAFQNVPKTGLFGVPAEFSKSGQLRVGVVAHFGNNLELETVRRAISIAPPSVRWIIVGHGPGLIPDKFVGMDSCYLAGPRSHTEIKSFLRHECDVALVPYDADTVQSGIPGFFSARKVREYLAAGVPVLVPDIPGKDEVLQGGENSLFFVPGDEVSLVDQLRRIADDGRLHLRLRQGAFESGEQLDWSRVAGDAGLIQLLRDVME